RAGRGGRCATTRGYRPTRSRVMGARSEERARSRFVEALAPNPRDHLRQSVARLEAGEEERPLAAHRPGVALHHGKAGADVRREVDLVDDQEIRARDARSALARNLVAARDVDDIDRGVDELGAEA